MKTFDEIQGEGIEKHGIIFLNANSIAVEIATKYGIDVTKEPYKTAISAICLGFCNRTLVAVILKEYEAIGTIVRAMNAVFSESDLIGQFKEQVKELDELYRRWINLK